MPRKRKRRYGDYSEVIDGQLYGSVSIPLGKGKYQRRRKKVDTKTDARNWALAELEKAKHGIHETDLETFGQLCEWYKKHFLVEPVYERGLRIEGTKDWQKNRAKLDRIAQYFAAKRLRSFSERDLLAYARSRRETVTQATINRDLSLIRSMFRKGHESDSSIKIPKIPINLAAENERDRVMSFAEEKLILAACIGLETLEYQRKGKQVKTDKHHSKREHLKDIVIFAVDTAMRKGELLSLTREDVDLEKGVITVKKQNTKTQKSRKVPITARVKEVLERLPQTGKLFSIKNCYKSFNTACARAGITDLNFHDLRHTATTRMIRAGIPYMEVMKITGHTQIKTFLRYLNPEDETVQTAAARLDKLLDDL